MRFAPLVTMLVWSSASRVARAIPSMSGCSVGSPPEKFSRRTPAAASEFTMLHHAASRRVDGLSGNWP